MPKISKEQLEEWAQAVYDNCGEGENFSNSLYSVVMEMRDAAQHCVHWTLRPRSRPKTKINRAQRQ